VVITGERASVMAVTDECTCATESAISTSGAAVDVRPTSAKAQKSRADIRQRMPRAMAKPDIARAASRTRAAISVTGGTAATAILVNMKEVPQPRANPASSAYSTAPGARAVLRRAGVSVLDMAATPPVEK
jgi:hypothetical protein